MPTDTESAAASTSSDDGKNSASAVPGSGALPVKEERTYSDAEVQALIKDRLDRQKRALEAEQAKARQTAEDATLAEQGQHKERAEKLDARVRELEAAATQAQAAIRTTRLESLVTRLAAPERLNLVDADAALRLLDTSAVQWDGDAPIESSVESALAALVKARPYLVRPATAAPLTGGAPTTPGKGGSGALTVERIKAMTPQEYGAHRAEIQAFLATQ